MVNSLARKATEMLFEISDKVAIVTGGASGIGLEYVKELLSNGARAVTLADVNEEAGKQAVEDLTREFGANRALFVKADVTNKEQFEEIFKKTVSTFKNVDILINNAGILNDVIWEKEIAINLNGTVYGILLALDNYIKNYKTGDEGLIVNISSVAALMPIPFAPIYAATKVAVLGLTTSFGAQVHYDRTKVRVVAVCPGVTDTPLIREAIDRTLGEEYKKILFAVTSKQKSNKKQTAEQMAKSLIQVVRKAKPASVWVAEGGEEPYEIEYLHQHNLKRMYS